MTKREFKDRIGMTWQVWEDNGGAGRGGRGRVKPTLYFRSGGTVKRVSPVPAGWAELSEDQLKTLWREADFDDADEDDVEA
jgi:hypothetical protein